MAAAVDLHTVGPTGGTLAVGDYVVLSGAVRDILLHAPDRFDIGVFGCDPGLFAGHPRIRTRPRPGARRRFTPAGAELRPDLHLDPGELAEPLIEGPYWVMAAGGKRDMPAKMWPHRHWIRLAEILAGRIRFVQVGSSRDIHPPVPGTVDRVGRTSVRDLMRLVAGAQGVVCHVTCLMHMAAAFNRPCVVIAGGREPPTWEAYTVENRELQLGRSSRPPAPAGDYVPHRFLHRVGILDCCREAACWKSHLGPGRGGCLDVRSGDWGRVPACLLDIPPEEAAEAVLSYGTGGGNTFPPPPAAPPRRVLLVVDGSDPWDPAWAETLARRAAGMRILLDARGAGEEALRAARRAGWETGLPDKALRDEVAAVRLGGGAVPAPGWVSAVAAAAMSGAAGSVIRRIRLEDGSTRYVPDRRFLAVPAAAVGVLDDREPDVPRGSADLRTAGKLRDLGIPVENVGGLLDRFPGG